MTTETLAGQNMRNAIRQMLNDWNNATPEQRAEAIRIAAERATLEPEAGCAGLNKARDGQHGEWCHDASRA